MIYHYEITEKGLDLKNELDEREEWSRDDYIILDCLSNYDEGLFLYELHDLHLGYPTNKSPSYTIREFSRMLDDLIYKGLIKEVGET